MKKRTLSLFLSLGILLSSTCAYADSYMMHTIQWNDTYQKIAKKYNQSVDELEELNNDLGKSLYAGNLMKIEALPNHKNISIQVDGKEIHTDTTPYLENGRTFVPIRFISNALGVEEIQWDANKNTVIIQNNQSTISLPIRSQTAMINDQNIPLDAPINIYNGRTFVPLRFIAETFHCTVAWDPEKYIVYIQTKENTTYLEEDLYWLSRIVEAEASDEPFDGKLAVANVIINRKNSADFPNTIKEVVFDKEYGFQFTPVMNNTIYNTPSQESIIAAKEALLGNNNIGNALYFLNPRISTSFWITANRTFYKTINLHNFYL
ncbi:stalk domain-containing protein [Inediibacterium massiliense]|uniref:stalk domain-containing protein n=1 Tax=Inediibacterium massiliense TaxID=1658111 RepID=UPI0006B58142|nr:stalk domain-containing protein [Inediibacterium massiliense]